MSVVPGATRATRPDGTLAGVGGVAAMAAMAAMTALAAMAAISALSALCVPPAIASTTAPGVAGPAAAAREARAWRSAHERAILAEFASLLALPNVASDAPGIERNVAALAAMLERRGLTVQVLREPGAPPLVVADLAGRAAARTIAFYAHYDGQPTDTLSWHGLPWTPVLRDRAGHDLPLAADAPIDPEARLYARSAGDDKAAIVAMLVALDALRARGHAPAFHLRLVFEGEEEAGSPHLASYMQHHPDLLRPAAWLICDGPVHQSGRMELGFGARGTTSVDLTVYGPLKGLHDGHYGNWVPNPIARLVQLLASMRNDDGDILVPGFMDDVTPPTAAERAAVAAVPDVEQALRAEFQVGPTEGHGAALNLRLMLPAVNLRGIQSGSVGERASNTIQTEARASVDFRLVPAQTPESVRARVEAYVTQLGWTIVRETPDSLTRVTHDKLVKLAWGPGYPPARTALDEPFALGVAATLAAIGHDPVRLPTLGGSVPMYLFQQPNGTPAIILPIANHDDAQHAPNENLRLQNLWDGIEVFAALFASLER